MNYFAAGVALLSLLLFGASCLGVMLGLVDLGVGGLYCALCALVTFAAACQVERN